jgi:hypothetical protein
MPSASRRHGPLACKGGVGRVLGVEIVVLATPAAILLIGRRDLEDRNASLLHEAQQPCAVAARGFYADALQVPEGAHPDEHLPIALAGSGEGLRSEYPILLVNSRSDVKILVRIDATNDAAFSSFDNRHSQPPAFLCTNGLAGTECVDRTVTRP